MAFFVILLSALRLSQAASRQVLFVIQALGIVACVLLTLLPLFYSKVDIIRSSSIVSTGKSSSTSKHSAMAQGPVSLGAPGVSLGGLASTVYAPESYASARNWSVKTNTDVSVTEHDLAKENDDLRSENALLRKELDELRSRLTRKKAKRAQRE